MIYSLIVTALWAVAWGCLAAHVDKKWRSER